MNILCFHLMLNISTSYMILFHLISKKKKKVKDRNEIFNKCIFVKHDLKGMLKCLGIETWTYFPHRRDRHP
jgi:hypothetical protein